MRTDDEIVARVKSLKEGDFLGFQTGDLIMRLPFHVVAAEGLIKPEVRAESWTVSSRSSADVLNEMRDYIAFAWDKAMNHRGISAERSIGHYEAWVWLLGDPEFQAVDWKKYRNYGAPVLREICVYFNLPFPEDRERAERMADGKLCRPACDDGCASYDEEEEDDSPVIESVDQPRLPEKS